MPFLGNCCWFWEGLLNWEQNSSNIAKKAIFNYNDPAWPFRPLCIAGNALERVHEPADHWDIASSTMCTRCFEIQSSPGCTCTRRSKFLTHSLHCTTKSSINIKYVLHSSMIPLQNLMAFPMQFVVTFTDKVWTHLLYKKLFSLNGDFINSSTGFVINLKYDMHSNNYVSNGI